MRNLLTHSGLLVDLYNFKVDDVYPPDIAVALSRQPRFNGHTKEFYSVAEHCILVSSGLELMGCSLEIQLQGLLHDAAEAYTGDLVYGMDKERMGEFLNVERGIESAIAEWFGVDYPFDPVVKEADLRVLATERRDILPGYDHSVGVWSDGGASEPFFFKAMGLHSAAAEGRYLLELESLVRRVDGKRY